MKTIFRVKVFLLSLFFITSLSAKPFLITGKIRGKEVLRFVYVLENDYGKILQVAPVIDHGFSVRGEFSDHPRFGALPTVNVLFLKDSLSLSEIRKNILTSQRRHYVCTIISESFVTVNYDTDKKVFHVEGSEQNKIQSLYLDRLAEYRNTRDSLFKLVRMTNEDIEAKNEKIDRIGADLFTATMRDFVKILKEHPDRVSLSNFNGVVYDQQISSQEALAAFNFFPPEIRNSEYGQLISKDIQDKKRMEELITKPAFVAGQLFPSFVLPDTKGIIQSSGNLLGKYTLVDFWATWCGPCRAETPNLINAFKNFHKVGFNVITVSIDALKDREKWLKAISDDQMLDLSNLFNGDDASGLARQLKVVAIPMNYLLDEKGKIIATNLRGEQLIQKLEELFKK